MTTILTPDVLSWFRESSSYIEHHRNKTVVISIKDDIINTHLTQLAKDISILHRLGVNLVLVHGTRNSIDRALKTKAIDSSFFNNIRLTDGETMSEVKRVIGEIQSTLIEHITAQPPVKSQSTQMNAALNVKSHITVCSGNFISAQPIGIIEGVDYKFTGKVRHVNKAAIESLLDSNHIVLASPIGYSPSGESFNLSSEETAVAIASALNADKLIFITNTSNLIEANAQPIDVLTPHEARVLASQLNLPIATTLNHSANACEQGVARVHLINQNQDGALFYELYTRDGVGTMVTQQTYENIRPAKIEDVIGIIALLKPLEENGTVVYRSREQIELEIKNFTVMERDGRIIGCVALYPYQEEHTAEVACLIVAPDYNKAGRGNTLLISALEQAKNMHLSSVFVLTTQTQHWFTERGFEESSTDALPADKQSLYNWQRQSKVLFKPI